MRVSGFDPDPSLDEENLCGGVSKVCFRTGKILVVPLHNAPLVPCDCCIKCGQPAWKELPRKLTYSHPGWFALHFLGPLVLLAILFNSEREVRITVGVCRKHLSVYRRRKVLAWFLFALFAGMLGICIAGASRLSVAVSLITLAGLLAGSLVMACRAGWYPISARRIDDHHAEIKGAGERYLHQFREL